MMDAIDELQTIALKHEEAIITLTKKIDELTATLEYVDRRARAALGLAVELADRCKVRHPEYDT